MTTSTKTLPGLLAEVSAGMARIEKRGRAPQAMGGFPFVQITDVMEALKPLLDERGILLRPDVEDVRVDLYPREGKDSPGVLTTVKLAVYAVHDGEEALLGRVVGQGADTQDKATGKAISAGLKQAILVAFAIPTGDDPEATHLDSGNGSQAASSPAQRPTAAPVQAADNRPTSSTSDDGARCPKHGKEWRTNRRGYYCATKDENTESGWCEQKPSEAWAASQEVA